MSDSVPNNLVERWSDDMDISSDSTIDPNDDFFLNELQRLQETYPENKNSERSLSVEDFVGNQSRDIEEFDGIYDLDMNYYQESYNYKNLNNRSYRVDERSQDFNEESMLGPISESNAVNDPEIDPDFDAEVNELLDKIDEDLVEPLETKDVKGLDDVKEQYEDYYQDFPDEKEDGPDEIPLWYHETLQKKVRETKRRLSDLSSIVCMLCPTAREFITRIELDHNTPFCKLDPPKHPPLKKPWTNYWKFNCVTKCNADPLEEEHAHTIDCEVLLLEHVGTSITTKSDNIFESEFPDFIIQTVKLFQEFADFTSRNRSLHTEDDFNDTIYEKPTWTYIKIRSNYKNELQLTVCGKAIGPLISHLRRFFHFGPGRTCNVVSLYCINIKWSQKKGPFHPSFLDGCLELRDKVGPITINYTPKTNINFNSIEAIQLGKAMTELLEPTPDTTVIDIGCNIGVLSLMLSPKCDKVIGLNPLQHEVDTAENLKTVNRINNATFIACQAKDVRTKCLPFLKKCMSVAILNLGTTYGKNQSVYKGLRNLPTVWRVIVYGAFTKEYHKCITQLTCRDPDEGDEFMPMRGCMIDKSPSIPNAFDILVLFERKSLVEPSVEYLKILGPTLNIKEDFEDKWNSNSNDGHKFFVNRKFKPKGKFGGFDSPSLPLENLPPAEIDPTPYNSVRGIVLKKNKNYDCPSIPSEDETSNSSLTSKIKIENSSSSTVKIELDSLSDSTTSSPPSKRKEFDFLEEIMPVKPRSEPFNQKLVKIKKETKPALCMENLPIRCKEDTSNTSSLELPEIIPRKGPFNQKAVKKNPGLLETHDCPTFKNIKHEKKTRVNPPLPKRPYYDSVHLPPLPPEQPTRNFLAANPFSVKKENEWTCTYPIPQANHQSVNIKREKWSPDLPPQLNDQSNTVKREKWSPEPRPPGLNDIPITVKREKLSPEPSPPGLNDRPITVKREKLSPELPLELNDQPVKIKKEKESYNPLPLKQSIHTNIVHIKNEPEERRFVEKKQINSESCLLTEREEGELSSDDSNHGLLTNIPEYMDLDSNNISIKCKSTFIGSNSSMPITSSRSTFVKSEYADVDDDEEPIIIEPPPVKIEQIVIKDENDPFDDFENMKTPVHVPHSPSPPPATANFKTVEGYEFSVKPNQSFLYFKESESASNVIVKQEKEIKFKQEPLDELNSSSSSSSSSRVKNNEDKIKIVDEKPKKELKDRLKYVIDESRSYPLARESKDLRKLIEKKNTLQKQLVEEEFDYPSTFSRYRRSRSRSNSPRGSWNRRYRSPGTESRIKREPLSPRSYSRRSPNYSLSPVRFNERSLTPSSRYTRYSPTLSRYKRSPPLSPTKYSRSGYSKYPTSYSRLALSPSPRSGRRSPSYEPYVPQSRSPVAYKYMRQSPSPPSRLYKYSSITSSSSSTRRSSISPVFRRNRSRSNSTSRSRLRSRSRSPFSISSSPKKSREVERHFKKKRTSSERDLEKDKKKKEKKRDKDKEKEKRKGKEKKKKIDEEKKTVKEIEKEKVNNDKTAKNTQVDEYRKEFITNEENKNNKSENIEMEAEKVKTMSDEYINGWDITSLSALSNQ